MNTELSQNKTVKAIMINSLLSAVSLFFFGFGLYLTMTANIGAGPWEAFSQGISKTFGILYGTASIILSLAVLIVDIAMREPIGISMFLDAVVVGKAVDFFNWIHLFDTPDSLVKSLIMFIAGLLVTAYTQYFYMISSLGCGPRDTLLVGLKKRIKKVPIGAVSIAELSLVTIAGWLLGGQIGIGTLLFAFGSGPALQLALYTFKCDATAIKHQNLKESWEIISGTAAHKI